MKKVLFSTNKRQVAEWKTPILIYGTGLVAQDVWRVLTSKGIPISCFIDYRTRENPFLAGVPISPPDSPSIKERAQTFIILAIHNREVNMPPLISRLKGLGYTQFITMIDLYDHFADELGRRYWLTERTFYTDYEQEIESTANMFSDQTSRDLFESILHFRITGEYDLLPEPDITHQYFPSDLPPWKKPLRLIDCGAFDGDTIKSILSLHIPIEALAAYEPDELNFRELVKTVCENHVLNAMLWPCAVYSTTKRLRFSTGQGEASLLSNRGEEIIQCVSLDESAPFFNPTLIKMDIEGAEIEALHGAENIIAKFQPGLAISIYHAPEHLWEIPMLILEFANKHDLQYNYYLRTHAFNSFETVFYAISGKGGS